ncbi:hypothetical protein SAMN02910317_00933 [Ruminococcaceae bacterium FB2012]|nr:hypothetical protein SAMN02910317_00933 [Ruminococcaceae bacterium FB2012]
MDEIGRNLLGFAAFKMNVLAAGKEYVEVPEALNPQQRVLVAEGGNIRIGLGAISSIFSMLIRKVYHKMRVKSMDFHRGERSKKEHLRRCSVRLLFSLTAYLISVPGSP